MLTKKILRDAACIVSEDAENGRTPYSCYAVAEADGDRQNYKASPAAKAYIRLAVECGAYGDADNPHLYVAAFEYNDETGCYRDPRESANLRFDFLNLLAESL